MNPNEGMQTYPLQGKVCLHAQEASQQGPNCAINSPESEFSLRFKVWSVANELELTGGRVPAAHSTDRLSSSQHVCAGRMHFNQAHDTRTLADNATLLASLPSLPPRHPSTCSSTLSVPTSSPHPLPTQSGATVSEPSLCPLPAQLLAARADPTPFWPRRPPPRSQPASFSSKPSTSIPTNSCNVPPPSAFRPSAGQRGPVH